MLFRSVYSSISGYGADGPWVHRRAYAPVVGVESGFTRMQGDARGGHYANDPWSHADTYTALETTVAILAALHRLERTGRGERIDVSMAETMLYVNEHAHDELYDGPVDPAWIRSFQPGDYPMLAVADGTQVLISGHPAERGTFELVIDAMDRTDLADDPRFVDVPARRRHFDELLDLMRAWAARFPDARTFEERCSRSGLAVGEMRTVRELADSDWADARGAIARIPDRDGGTLRIPNPPWHFSGATVGPRGTGRYRGEDNRAVLGEILGLDAATLDDLEARGILTSRVPKG